MAEWLSDVSVGQWFEGPDGAFEIVGMDVAHELVLVQFYDGTLEEFDFDQWVDLAARSRPPPEDPLGAFDHARDDFGLDDGCAGTDLGDPLERLERLGW